MTSRNAARAALALFLLSTPAADAGQHIELEFRDGRVWLLAADAPVREILREWARRGAATIIDGDKVEGEPVTLELVGVPERQALATILRDVPGYILGPRAPDSPGTVFDRIVIVAKTTTPLATALPQPSGRPSTPDRSKGGLPEPLASILGSVTDVADVQPADVDDVDDDVDLPDALSNMLRSVTSSTPIAPSSSRP